MPHESETLPAPPPEIMALATLLQTAVEQLDKLAEATLELQARTERDARAAEERIDQLVHRVEGLTTRLSTLEGWFHDLSEEVKNVRPPL